MTAILGALAVLAAMVMVWEVAVIALGSQSSATYDVMVASATVANGAGWLASARARR